MKGIGRIRLWEEEGGWKKTARTFLGQAGKRQKPDRGNHFNGCIQGV